MERTTLCVATPARHVRGALGLILVSGLAACAQPPGAGADEVAETRSPVIAGNPVSPNSSGFVFFVSTVGFCSGTLMSNTWVLTAKHCVADADVASPMITVMMGTQAATVVEVIRYPDDDVALLRLGGPLSMNGSPSGFEMRLYPGRNGTLVGTLVSCFGFGESVLGVGSSAGTLRSASLPVRSYSLTGHLEVNPNSSGQFLSAGDSGGACLTRLPSGESVLAGVYVAISAGATHDIAGTFNILVDPDVFRNWYANVRATHAVSNGATNKCLDGVAEQQWACQNIVAQEWRLAPAGGGWYEIRAASSGHCLGSSGGPLWTQDCDGSNRTRWSLVNGGGDFYSIHNGQSGQCLDVPGGSTNDGLPLQTYPCNGGNNQLWRFEARFDPMFQSLTPAVANGISCLDVQGGGSGAQAHLQTYGCHGGDNQQWSLQGSGGTHTAHPRQAPGMCADVPGASSNQFVQLQQYPCNGGSNQTLSANWHDGSYSLVVGSSGNLCLSAWAQGAATNGTQVQQVNCGTAGFAQLWNLY